MGQRVWLEDGLIGFINKLLDCSGGRHHSRLAMGSASHPSSLPFIPYGACSPILARLRPVVNNAAGRQEVNRIPENCMGCGVCVLKCEPEALTMELVHPPEWIPKLATT